MDREIDPRTGDYSGQMIDSLQNAVYVRLATPLGTWWGDVKLGSLLHLIQREKDKDRVGTIARQYAEEALKPLLDDGRAQRITVTETQPHNGTLVLDINVKENNGNKFTYQHEVPVI